VIELGPNRYGKEQIRLVKVVRAADGHRVRDLTVGVRLEGDFEAAHVDGDNALVVATDTMKNTVYAFAVDHLDGSIEAFGIALRDHFLGFPQVSRASIGIAEHEWRRLPTASGPAPDAFARAGELTRVATVSGDGGGGTVEAGIEDLVVLKTTKSAFSGFPRDRYTTLPETEDRLLATRMNAAWRYRDDDVDYDTAFGAVRATLLDVFAGHFSRSVQESVWLMGRAVLGARPEVEEVRLALPNLHHWRVDLAPFGLENRDEIFVSTTEPHGLIEGTVRRAETVAPPGGDGA
jgi:urate oxidase